VTRYYRWYVTSGSITNHQSFQATASRASRINLLIESFQAQHPSRSNQPIELHNPQHPKHKSPHRVSVRVGWAALGAPAKTPVKVHGQRVTTPPLIANRVYYMLLNTCTRSACSRLAP
ncbi:unnamed protein product, partial [Laminaria digitata]